MHTIRRSVISLIALSVVVASACARRNSEPRPIDPPTFAEVDNRAYLDATVYVLRSSQRIRLGFAPGGRRSVFRIPRDVMFGPTYLSFQIDFVGSSRMPRSESINVTPGDTVTLMIPPS